MEEPEYIVEDAAEVVLQNIPLDLQEKFTFDDIVKILETEFEFLQESNVTSEHKSIVEIPVELDEDAIKYFIINRCAKKNILLTYNELQAILDAEFIYTDQQGLIDHEGLGKYYN